MYNLGEVQHEYSATDRQQREHHEHNIRTAAKKGLYVAEQLSNHRFVCASFYPLLG